MKLLRIAIVALLGMGAAGSPARSDVTLTEDFTAAGLVFQAATSAVETYRFNASPFGDTVRSVTVSWPLLRTKPAILASGPLGKAWVFATGTSSKFRDVHWSHYVDIVYRSWWTAPASSSRRT